MPLIPEDSWSWRLVWYISWDPDWPGLYNETLSLKNRTRKGTQTTPSSPTKPIILLRSNMGSIADWQSGQPAFWFPASLHSFVHMEAELVNCFHQCQKYQHRFTYMKYETSLTDAFGWRTCSDWLSLSYPYVAAWSFFFPSLPYRCQASILLGFTCFLLLSSWSPHINSSNNLSEFLNFSKTRWTK